MTLNKEFRPIAMVNITNRCTLKCKHCFVYRKGTPNTPTKKNEMPVINKYILVSFIFFISYFP